MERLQFLEGLQKWRHTQIHALLACIIAIEILDLSPVSITSMVIAYAITFAIICTYMSPFCRYK